jgi:hypothetical protein
LAIERSFHGAQQCASRPAARRWLHLVEHRSNPAADLVAQVEATPLVDRRGPGASWPRNPVDSIAVIQLIYSSAATTAFSAEALRTLLLRARAHNTTEAISGMLLHVDGAFFQVLEGEPAAVRRLFAKISGDHRHTKVLLLLEREITARNFPDWSMGFFDASGRGSLLPGYRKTSGFADLLGDTAMIQRTVTEFRDGRWRSIAAR